VRTNRLRLQRHWTGLALTDRRVPFFLLLLLALDLVAPISAQTSENIGQMTDERYRQWIADADAVAVQEINRRDAYAVAARYWEDAIDISPAGVALRSNGASPKSSTRTTQRTSPKPSMRRTCRVTRAGSSAIGVRLFCRPLVASAVPSKVMSPLCSSGGMVSGKHASTS
jgi:hypothetical protein